MDNNNMCPYNKLETLCKEMSESLKQLKDSDNISSSIENRIVDTLYTTSVGNTSPNLFPYTIEPDTLELFVDEDNSDDGHDEFHSTITIKLKDIK